MSFLQTDPLRRYGTARRRFSVAGQSELFRTKALVIAGVLAALLSLVIDSSVGPRPLVWLNFKFGTLVIHVPWLIALFFISAVATFLAKRNGARLSQCLLVGISPALIIGTLFSLLMAVIVVMAASGAAVFILGTSSATCWSVG